jgi:hypothetical protein
MTNAGIGSIIHLFEGANSVSYVSERKLAVRLKLPVRLSLPAEGGHVEAPTKRCYVKKIGGTVRILLDFRRLHLSAGG